MAGTLEFQGGSTAAMLAYTGAARQIVIDTDHEQCRVMDGFVAGGVLIGGARRDTQVGTTYTVLTADQGKIITFSNGASVAVTLPQAGSSGGTFMAAQTGFLVLNLGAGVVTITPGTSTINGLATLTLNQYDGARIISDGTNYLAVIGRNAASGGGSGTPGGSTYAIQYAATASTFGGIGPLTDGQLVIGRTGTTAVPASLSAGAGITISASAGVITIAASASGIGFGLYQPIISAVPTDANTGLTTWANQSTATRSNGATGLSIINASSHASDSANVLFKTAGSAPVSYSALLAINYAIPIVNNMSAFIGFSDGTKFEFAGLIFESSTLGWDQFVNRWNTTTSVSGNVVAPTANTVNGDTLVWVKAFNDGTNLNYYFSRDGVNFNLAWSAGVTSFLSAATNICLAINTWSAGSVTIMDWTQGTS